MSKITNILATSLTPIRQVSGRALYIDQSGAFYIAQKYKIYRSIDNGVTWQYFGQVPCPGWKSVVAGCRLSARLLRFDIMAFGMFSDGAGVAVVRDGLYCGYPGDATMTCIFPITRGSRPINLTIDSRDRILFGEYGDMPHKELYLYCSEDKGASFHVAHAFPVDDIRHIHNVVEDPFEDFYWVFVGDYNNQPGIGQLSSDFTRFDWVARGNQEVRVVRAIIDREYLYYGTDSDIMQNYIIRLNKRTGHRERLAPINGSSFYGARFGNIFVISSCVEPSRVNASRTPILYASTDGENWQVATSGRKDWWHPVYFQFGTFVLPVNASSGSYGMYSGQALQQIDNQVVIFKC